MEVNAQKVLIAWKNKGSTFNAHAYLLEQKARNAHDRNEQIST